MKAITKHLTFLNPLNWLIWFLLSLLWLITRLPYRLQKKMGHGIGKIIYYCAPKMRHITQINLALCFPELSEKDRHRLMKKNFASLGMGIVETAMAWWISDKRLEKCVIKVTGADNMLPAWEKGNGAILLSPHTTCLEMIGRLLGSRYPFAAMYRPHKIQLIASIQERFREKYRIKHIARHRMRELLNTLSANTAVWYAYDIDGGPKRSVFAPFFGIETASLTAVTRIVNLSNTVVMPIQFYRMDDCWGYEINLSPPLDHFPGNNLIDDATRLNRHLEDTIRKKPEQYIWQYKRFKTRPEGEKRFY